LSTRINQYIGAAPKTKAGQTNKMVYSEQRRLRKQKNTLYIECMKRIKGFDLSNKKQRKAAEGLLIAVSKPYLQF
jgi:hypothetical protein